MPFIIESEPKLFEFAYSNVEHLLTSEMGDLYLKCHKIPSYLPNTLPHAVFEKSIMFWFVGGWGVQSNMDMLYVGYIECGKPSSQSPTLLLYHKKQQLF